MVKRFAPQYKQIQDALYPELANLDKTLTNQAQAGIESDMPEYMRQQYQDQFRAEVGGNAGSGIGADYVSRNMIAAGQQYKQSNQNLALSLTGRQALYQATPGGYQQNFNAANGYNYGATSSFQASGYGNYAGAYSNMYSANGQYQANLNKLYQGYADMGMKAGGAFMGF